MTQKTSLWIRRGLMAFCLTVGVALLLLAFRSPSTQTFTVPSYSMSVIGALQPAPVAKPVDVPAGSRVDMDWQFGLNCEAEGTHTWTHEDASGNITFYCKK